MQAYANPGYVFAGWGLDASVSSSSALHQFVLTQPMGIAPVFLPARKIHLRTDPPEMAVLANQARVQTPSTIEVAALARVPLGGVSPQHGHGTWWVFDGWDFTKEAAPVFVAPEAEYTESTLTARYVRASAVTFFTQPAGLKLSVDGRDNWPSWVFLWGASKTHTFAAPAEQRDARGRLYRFKNWGHGGEAAQTFTMPEDPGLAPRSFTANYELVPRLTVQSTTPAIELNAGGQPCRTPCSIDRPRGTVVTLRAPETIARGPSTRLEFETWNGEAGLTRQVSVEGDSTWTASYRTMHQLGMSSQPAEAVSFKCEPASADNFYSAGTAVRITATARPGFRFLRWDGDLGGQFPAGTVLLSSPRAVKAVAETAPFADPAGVSNAAGETPVEGVAPGSMASVRGANLANTSLTGPRAPLAQTLGGVVVRIAGYPLPGEHTVLPLFSIAPARIDFQVPAELPEDRYTLVVTRAGAPDVRAVMKVVRNAPGLFTQRDGELEIALATHASGLPVNSQNPARPGEVITVYGTGFGAYDKPPLDGFPVPEEDPSTITDPIDAMVGDTVVEARQAQAAPGNIGLNIVRFTVPERTGSGRLRIVANGVPSNTVVLPAGAP
ncbi:MAG: hypothetical protein FJW40_06625 [Acidobacteria bacterium]|nr:hypothetical protein [Acidobacteriota bacterium]